MKRRTFEGMVAYFNKTVADMDIPRKYKMELLGMITAILQKHDEEVQCWVPCSERLPELDADGYSDKVLVCFSNFTGCEICEYRECDDCHGWYVGDSDENPEDIGVHVIAWMPLPKPYTEETNAQNN